MLRRLRLRNSVPLPEIDEDDLCDAVTRLWITGHSDRECRRILGLTQSQFLRTVAQLRTVNVDETTALEQFQIYADAFDKFRLMCEARVKQLNDILTPLMEPHPIDGCAINPGSARRILKQITQLDEMVFAGQTQLLLAKVRLGLVEKPQQQRQEYLPGQQLSPDSLFKSSTVREAWRLRLLSEVNGNGNSRN